MRLYSYQVPTAYSMLAFAKKLPDDDNMVFGKFMCLWVAFNDIYATVADMEGCRPRLKKHPDGTLKTRNIGGVEIPQVHAPSERKQIDLAFNRFGDDLKDELIRHKCTEFFVCRIPKWCGHEIKEDAQGQRLNGVMNVGYTTDSDYPVWSPIDTSKYEQYIQRRNDTTVRTELAYQILYVLYGVRNNLFHGGKKPDDANDVKVIRCAIPLLIYDSYGFPC